MSSPAPAALSCYRHPKAEAPVACNRCDRPICTECMISAPVGWQCPSCVKGGPAVQNLRDVEAGGSLGGDRPYVTFGLIAACVVVFLLQRADATIGRYAISAVGIALGHVEELVTAGFLHADIIHIGFNMAILFQLGTVLEARLGRVRFATLYLAGLLGGAVGELLIGDPSTPAIGASGAVFALMGAILVMKRRSRFGIEGSVGVLLALNLFITFIPGLHIAIGGHIGGLVVGALVGAAYRFIGEGEDVARVAGSAAFALVVSGALVLVASPIATWAIQTRGG